MTKSRNRGMWEYLESIEGLLERGDPEEIKLAKREYRKIYLLNYKRKQRSQRDEFNVGFLKDSIDYGMIIQGAKKHNMTVPALLRSATLAYLKKIFIVPDKTQIAQMERLLSECLNEIQTIARRKERFYFDREQKYELIEKKIEILEKKINEHICQPLPVDEYVKRAVIRHPPLREHLLALLYNNDHKNTDPQDPKLQTAT